MAKPRETYDSAKLYFEVTFSLTSPSYILNSLVNILDGFDNEVVSLQHNFALSEIFRDYSSCPCFTVWAKHPIAGLIMR